MKRFSYIWPRMLFALIVLTTLITAGCSAAFHSGGGGDAQVVAPGSVTLSPASDSFGEVAIGSTSASRTATLHNTGKIALSVGKISTSVDFAQTNNCGSSLGGSMSCVITLTFTPTTTGTRTGTLTIIDSAGMQTVNLQGTGIVPVAITPASLTFGSIAVGKTSNVQPVTVTNMQTRPLSITSIVPNPADYTQTNNCTASLAAGAHCTVEVVFTPSAAGSRPGTLTITDSAVGSPQLVSLSGGGFVPALVSIAVTPSGYSIPAGGTVQFTATGTYSDGSTATLPAASTTFASSNATIATITNAGLATGVAAGTAGITATSGTVTSPAVTLTVTGPTLQTIVVSPANPSLAKGTNAPLQATGMYSDGSTQNLTTQVTWSSSASAVTVSNASGSQGVVTGANMGSATVSATSGTTPSVTGSTSVTVTAAALQSIAVTPATPSVAAGLMSQFTATGTFTDATTQDLTQTVTWSSSDQAVATISNTAGTQGQATALAQGSTNIVATSGSITGLTTLTVLAPVLVSIAVSPANPSIALGTTQQFTATGTYSDNSTQDLTTSASWASATTSVATISTTTGSVGLATSVTEGTTTITATSGTVNGMTALTVTAPVLTSITVSPAAASVHQGSTQQFTATGTFSDSTTQDITATVAWSAGDGTIATVSTSSPSQGLATGVAAGTVQIVATYTPAGGTAVTSANTGGGGNLTVIGLTSVTVAPSSPTISLGTAALQQFTATATFADSTTADVTTSATWSSSATTVATISNAAGTQGQATPVAAGATTITATYAAVPGSTVLTISPATLDSIAVAPASVSLGLNATQQYTATGTYSDGSTSDITTQVTWTSGDTTLVSISTSGLATVAGTSTSAIPISASLVNAAGATITSPPAWLSALSTLPIVCPAPTIDMKLLVVNNAGANAGAGYADFPAIQQILNYVGTPYEVVDVSGATPTLSDGACHGYYQGIIYAFGDDIYNNPALYTALTSYEQTFKVRQLNWFTNPTPDFGFNYYTGSVADTGTDTGSYTPAAVPIFFYANTATPVSISNAFIYLTTPLVPAGGSVTPLLTDPAGNTLSALTQFADGRQYLSQMFDSNPYLTHDLVVAYGLLNWVTQGVFLGDYHVYATQEVDDFFIDDSEWIPSTTCLSNPLTLDRTAPDASNLPVFRVNSADMTQLVAWQTGIQNDPSGLFSQCTYLGPPTPGGSCGFKLTLAMNGVGTAGNGNWTGLTAPLTTTSATNGIATFTSPGLSALPGEQVTITGSKNTQLNGTWTILAVTSNTSTSPGSAIFTANVGSGVNVGLTLETTATASIPDDLTANLQGYQGSFHWISHTYDHPSTLNGLCKSTPSDLPTCGDVADGNTPTDDIDLEILTNLWVASSPGGVNLDLDPSDILLKQLTFSDFEPGNIVTPGVTGLNDPNVPAYLSQDGISYAVSDTSVMGQLNNGPNPSPNVGIVNVTPSGVPTGIYEVPRRPNDIFYNVANWADDQAEFQCIYTYYVPPGSPANTTPAPDPPYNTFTAAQILDFVSSSFVSNMLMGDMDPQMFHQPDLHFSDNYANLNLAPVPASVGAFTAGQTTHVSSLLTDTYDLIFSKYEAVYKLPVLTPTLDQIGVLMQNRNSFNLSGVIASIVGAGTSSAQISLTVPTTATVTSAVIPVTGLTSNGSEIYGGQNISHITMTPGQTITLPLP